MDMIGEESTYEIIGAAMEVHKQLGSGFLEAVYQEALERELVLRGIPFEAQPQIQIFYKGIPLNKYYQADFVCFGDVIVELKAVSQITPEHQAQVLNYLKATGYQVALLLNFGTPHLDYRRFVSTH